MLDHTNSAAYYKRARAVMPGGVNSPVRAFGAVGGEPLFIDRAQGAYVWDADGNQYLDYIGSWGPLILGHAHPDVTRSVVQAAQKGSSYGAPCVAELELAELITGRLPWVEMLRMVNSGTEAVMSAVRLARGVTGRDKIVKFQGCYHGHSDSLLIKAGSGVLTMGLPDSPGVPADLARHTLTARYNCEADIDALFGEFGAQIACVVIEPVAGNMGVVPARKAFLEHLRAVTQRHGALLIFDEVMSGFRVAFGGAVERYGVIPDLVTYGKIIGGGLPVGAYGGKREYMREVAPQGKVYQAGTLSGNPLAMAAGLATLRILDSRPELYGRLETLAASLEDGMRSASADAGVPLTVNRVGSMVCAFFTDGPVCDFASATASDTQRYAAYFRYLLEHSVYVAPSQYETMFLSAAHNERHIAYTLEVMRAALQAAM